MSCSRFSSLSVSQQQLKPVFQSYQKYSTIPKLREKFDPELQIVDLVNNITNKNEIILFYFFSLKKTKLTLICRNGNVTFFRRCSHSKKRDIWVIFSDMKKRSDQCLKLAHQTVREPAQLFISHWGKPHFLSIN